jgi:hypothetical protein
MVFNRKPESRIEQLRAENRTVSIWIDDYDDLFSDFDPRPISERNISDDFLVEVNKIFLESDILVNEFRLLIPEKARDKEKEPVIIKRLHFYFRQNLLSIKAQVKEKNKKGVLLSVIGLLLMITASYIAYLKSAAFIMQIAFVIAEPAGWFLLWTGLDMLLYAFRDKKAELEFYGKITKAKISFSGI